MNRHMRIGFMMAAIALGLAEPWVLAQAPVALIEPGLAAIDSEPAETAADGIRLNFRGVPLDAFLDHLSKAAGFVIVKDAPVTGTVDAWSHQPLTHEEAFGLVNTVLAAKGLAAVRTERTLRIVNRDAARTYDLPVTKGNDPADIQKSDSIVTQIIPVRHANAAKMLDSLQPLLPSSATMTANESSNTILLTDTQTNIRRIVSIVQALDTSIADIAEIRVFALQHGDAEKLAEVITKALETPTDSSRAQAGSARTRNFIMRMRGGGGAADAGADAGQTSAVQTAASRVRAVADTHSNSVVVNAPGDLMESIATLVRQVDVPIEDTVRLRVFTLRYAEAQEMASSVNELFGENAGSTAAAGQRPPSMTAGRRVPGGRTSGSGVGGGASSQRELKEARVLATADTRSNSVIVTASEQSLGLVAQMIEQLDSSSRSVPQVYVYPIKHADLNKLQEMLSSMFEELDTGTATTSSSAPPPTRSAPTTGAATSTTTRRRQ